MQQEKIMINHYELDEEQKKPILENPKYSIIIAGAGSGKTLTLIGKVKYLLDHHLATKDEICCISFTKEAVKNLEQNILNNCHVNVPCFTFHKLALYILDSQKMEYQIAEEILKEKTIEEFFQTTYQKSDFIAKKIYRYFHIHGIQKHQKLQKKNKEKEIKLIKTFLDLYSSKNFQKEIFLTFFHQSKNKTLLFILYAIFIYYEQTKQKNHLIDFDDMIKKGIKEIQTNPNFLPFKYLIIDEFQDTSPLRFQLIEAILQKTNASLCVVGDDYQSIYHFSGCDLNLFLKFQTKFPTAKRYFLQTTYRNSQNLIQIAGKFIMKNPRQIPKELKSAKQNSKPIKLFYYSNPHGIIEKIIQSLPPNDTIFILSRNHFDLKKYTSIPYNNPQERIRFLTVHSSKGLEADHVILLNMANETYGFPSKIKEEKILSLVKSSFPFPYEEERRLFYVALTRTKKDIFLLIPRKNPSMFIKELKKESDIQIIHHPKFF